MKLTRRGKLVVALGVLVALLGIPAGAGYAYLRSIGVFGASDPGSKVEVEIPEGATAGDIGNVLEDEGVIESAFAWRISLFLDGGDADIQAGTYELPRGLTPRDALDLLREGPIVEFVTVTFPEGSWLTDFARILGRDTHISGKQFLALATSGRIRAKLQPAGVDTLEGLLFPSTYQVVEEDDAASLIRRMVTELEKRFSSLDAARLDRLGVSPYEAVIIASMVEAEAKAPSERAKIAAVVYNRLEAGIPLGIDATVLYALGEHKEVLTRSDLEIDSPYNTRKVAGLPPTPIGAAGMGSLEAAVEPANGEWLYYVLRDCEGHHAFSESYQEFLDNKAAYQGLEC